LRCVSKSGVKNIEPLNLRQELALGLRIFYPTNLQIKVA